MLLVTFWSTFFNYLYCLNVMHFSADFSDAVLTKIAKHIGHERRRLAALLGLGPPTIDQIEQNHAGVSKKINLAILQVLALL